MATAVEKRGTPIIGEGKGIAGATPTTTVATQTFKAGSLAELLELAAKAQDEAGITAPFQIHNLEAIYDIDTGVWNGRLGKA
ncbi:MAG: hypothetical protein FJ004_02430 [Chloroflexi bacterium]|nr:hypothetical protein [Chloroflexota bacterium]